MRAIVGSLLLGLGCAGTGMALHAQNVLTLRTAAQEGSAPKFIPAGTTAAGVCPEIMAAIERADRGLRFSIDARPTPIKRIESDLRDGRIDVACALLETDARKDMAHRINPALYVLQERLVGRHDDHGTISSLQDLAQSGALVVTQSGASYADDLRHAGVHVVETPGGSTVALRNVLNKRARFYYTNDLTGAYYIQHEGMGKQLRLHPGVLHASPSYLWASRKLDAAALGRLEQAVGHIKRNGELERIYQRYQQLQ